jgi:nicotinamide phosphoribosyltransferase
MSERQYVLNMIDKFAKPGAIFAMVADSYDVFKFCEMLGTDPEIKAKIEAHGATGGFVVIRPDSGDPEVVCSKLVQILDKYFGHKVNEKGFKVLNNVRLIQGDGVNASTIRCILGHFEVYKYSADNIAFGMGGQLLAAPQRDDIKWAMKASAVCINGEWKEVYKSPITDPGKMSKKGRVTLWKSGSEYQSAVARPTNWVDNGVEWTEALEEVYRDGKLIKDISFDEVRRNAQRLNT